MNKHIVSTGIAAIALALGAACGGDSSTPEVVVDETITIEARSVKFVPDEITVPVGKVVRLVLVNRDAGTEHDLVSDELMVMIMQGDGHASDHGSTTASDSSMMLAVHTKDGETNSVIFTATTPGTYNIYCTIPGHKDAGMVGTITVV